MAGMQNDVVYDVKGLIKDLQAVEPGLKKELVRDAKAIAKPIVSILKSQIPKTAPLSGMVHNGRLGWGVGWNANAVQVKFNSGRSRYTAVTPLVSIWVRSPMTAIADVAGKGGMRKAKRVTSEYWYKGGTRKHRVTSQGRWMIRGLKERNLNNFIYPNVEDRLEDAQSEVKLVIDRYSAKVNRKLN
jgi:hypothetical protein